MKRITSFLEAKQKLFEGKVLVFKPYNQQVTYLSLKDENRICLFSDNVRYNISFDELDKIMEINKVFEFKKDDKIEINQEFKKLIQ